MMIFIVCICGAKGIKSVRFPGIVRVLYGAEGGAIAGIKIFSAQFEQLIGH
jgi:hypothetical protein